MFTDKFKAKVALEAVKGINPRMTDWLNDEGHEANHKRVARLMQRMGLQAITPGPHTSKPSLGHKIIEQKLLQGFCVDIVIPQHLIFIGRVFRFNDNADGRVGIFPDVDNKIVATFGIDEVFLIVIGLLEEIRKQVFMELFRFALINSIKQTHHIDFEPFDINSTRLYLKKRLVQRLSRSEFCIFHGLNFLA